MRILVSMGMVALFAQFAAAQETMEDYPLPNMIGDQTFLPQGLMAPGSTLDFHAIANTSSGASRVRASRNNNIVPLTRIYFDHSTSENARFDSAIDSRDGDIHLGILGVEKSFLNNLFSVEVRLPFVSGLDRQQPAIINQPAVPGSGFGNMYLGSKTLLLYGPKNVLTAGLGFTLPTGSPTEFMLGNTVIADIQNTTGFIQPYVAYSRRSGAWFLQSWTGFDFAMGGNQISIGPVPRGQYQEQHLFLQDLQIGFWLFRNESSNRFIKGIAPLLELHYASTLNDTDNVNIVQDYRNPFNRVDMLNTTIGTQLDLGRFSTCRLGVSFPLRGTEFDDANQSSATLFAQWDLVRR